MADVAKITLPNGTTKDIKDATARKQANWNTNNGVKNFVKINTVTFVRSTIIDVEPISGLIVYSIDNIVSSDTTYTTSAILFEYSNGQQSNPIQLARGQKVSGTVNTENLIVAKMYLYASTGYVAGAGKTATFTNIMLTPKTLYDADSTYEPYALPNTKITPELIELVDSGAKNLLDINLSGAGGGNATCTDNGDGSITITPAAGIGAFTVKLADNMGLATGDYVLSINTPMGANNYITVRVSGGGQTAITGTTQTSVALNNKAITQIYIYLENPQSVTLKPMLCTKAAWDVSQKFVPYRPTYEETVEQVTKLQITEIAITVETAIDDLPMGTVTSSPAVSIAGYSANTWLVIHTYDLNTAGTRRMQVIEAIDNTRKTRFKGSGGWGNWV